MFLTGERSRLVSARSFRHVVAGEACFGLCQRIISFSNHICDGMIVSLRNIVSSLALVMSLFTPGAATADSDDSDTVRHLVDRGEIRPLAEILAIVRAKLHGKIAGVEIEQSGGRWIYEFRVVDTNGRLLDVAVDAHTAKIERIREK
jgi:hypothetical protein